MDGEPSMNGTYRLWPAQVSAVYHNEAFQRDDGTGENHADPYTAYRLCEIPGTSRRRTRTDPDGRNKTKTSYRDSYISRTLFKKRSTCRTLVIVFLILLMLGVIVAVIILAVLLTKTPSSPEEAFQSLVSLSNINFTQDLADPSSPAFKNLETEFCTQLLASLKSELSPVKDEEFKCEVNEFRNGSVIVFTLRRKPGSQGTMPFQEVRGLAIGHIQNNIRNGSIGNLKTNPNVVCSDINVGSKVDEKSCDASSPFSRTTLNANVSDGTTASSARDIIPTLTSTPIGIVTSAILSSTSTSFIAASSMASTTASSSMSPIAMTELTPEDNTTSLTPVEDPSTKLLEPTLLVTSTYQTQLILNSFPSVTSSHQAYYTLNTTASDASFPYNPFPVVTPAMSTLPHSELAQVNSTADVMSYQTQPLSAVSINILSSFETRSPLTSVLTVESTQNSLNIAAVVTDSSETQQHSSASTANVLSSHQTQQISISATKVLSSHQTQQISISATKVLSSLETLQLPIPVIPIMSSYYTESTLIHVTTGAPVVQAMSVPFHDVTGILSSHAEQASVSSMVMPSLQPRQFSVTTAISSYQSQSTSMPGTTTLSQLQTPTIASFVFPEMTSYNSQSTTNPSIMSSPQTQQASVAFNLTMSSSQTQQASMAFNTTMSSSQTQQASMAFNTIMSSSQSQTTSMSSSVSKLSSESLPHLSTYQTQLPSTSLITVTSSYQSQSISLPDKVFISTLKTPQMSVPVTTGISSSQNQQFSVLASQVMLSSQGTPEVIHVAALSSHQSQTTPLPVSNAFSTTKITSIYQTEQPTIAATNVLSSYETQSLPNPVTTDVSTNKTQSSEAFQSLISLSNVTFTQDLSDPSSPAFKKMENEFCAQLLTSLKSESSPVKDEELKCEVNEFRNGSVTAVFTLRRQPGSQGTMPFQEVRGLAIGHIQNNIRNGSIGNLKTNPNVVCSDINVGSKVDEKSCGTSSPFSRTTLNANVSDGTTTSSARDIIPTLTSTPIGIVTSAILSSSSTSFIAASSMASTTASSSMSSIAMTELTPEKNNITPTPVEDPSTKLLEATLLVMSTYQTQLIFNSFPLRTLSSQNGQGLTKISSESTPLQNNPIPVITSSMSSMSQSLLDQLNFATYVTSTQTPPLSVLSVTRLSSLETHSFLPSIKIVESTFGLQHSLSFTAIGTGSTETEDPHQTHVPIVHATSAMPQYQSQSTLIPVTTLLTFHETQQLSNPVTQVVSSSQGHQSLLTSAVPSVMGVSASQGQQPPGTTVIPLMVPTLQSQLIPIHFTTGMLSFQSISIPLSVVKWSSYSTSVPIHVTSVTSSTETLQTTSPAAMEMTLSHQLHQLLIPDTSLMSSHQPLSMSVSHPTSMSSSKIQLSTTTVISSNQTQQDSTTVTSVMSSVETHSTSDSALLIMSSNQKQQMSISVTRVESSPETLQLPIPVTPIMSSHHTESILIHVTFGASLSQAMSVPFHDVTGILSSHAEQASVSSMVMPSLQSRHFSVTTAISSYQSQSTSMPGTTTLSQLQTPTIASFVFPEMTSYNSHSTTIPIIMSSSQQASMAFNPTMSSSETQQALMAYNTIMSSSQTQQASMAFNTTMSSSQT